MDYSFKKKTIILLLPVLPFIMGGKCKNLGLEEDYPDCNGRQDNNTINNNPPKVTKIKFGLNFSADLKTILDQRNTFYTNDLKNNKNTIHYTIQLDRSTDKPTNLLKVWYRYYDNNYKKVKISAKYHKIEEGCDFIHGYLYYDEKKCFPTGEYTLNVPTWPGYEQYEQNVFSANITVLPESP